MEGKTFSYDADGNLTSNGTSSFEWNDRNQLVGVTQGSEKWGYAYDPFGRRISKSVNGVETKYLYDGENVVRESSEGKTDGLINGLSLDERFARTTSAGTSSYLTEELGSTLALANTSGIPTTEYTYGPFGEATSSGTTSTNPYQYTGREGEENRVQYNRARYYSSALGRFISQDPLGMAGSGINLYRYAGDDPLNATDPLGTTVNPTETLPGGNEGKEIHETDNEIEGLPPNAGGPGSPANLAAPKGSGGWGNVACKAATPIPGKAGLGVAGACGIELQPIGHIPNLPEVLKKTGEGIRKAGEFIGEGVEETANVFTSLICILTQPE